VVPHPLLSDEYAALARGAVLVGDDGSDGARTAIEAAAGLFPTRDRLLVTVDDGQTTQDETDAPHAGGALSRLRVPAGRGAPARSVAGALAECARSHDAAVLVVGSRGRSAVEEILLGSVAMATLHHAYRPVMVSATRRRPGSGPV
jgi:nucleotide-binding universal stress UspA family protein